MTRRIWWVAAVAFVTLAGLASWGQFIRAAQPAQSHSYQAVLLTNGQVYFGKLEGVGTKFPVLTEVYYVQAGVDPATKQTRSVLLKRGKEWHSPDRMTINADHILLIEPVGPDSQVAQLIRSFQK